MPIISATALAKGFGEKTVFSDVSFGMDRGEKIALIGINGTGKSTLLRILAGREKQDSGNIIFERGLSISYLPQNIQYDPASTVIEHIFSRATPEAKAIRRYEACLEAMQHSETPALQHELGEVMDSIESLNAWDYERRIRAVLDTFGIDNLLQPMSELSGGMRKKVALAEVIISEADLLILDEPTNHLDIATILWLEDYLMRSVQSVFVVSHDRYFLDAVASGVFELWRGGLYRYDGNYDYYLEKKSEFENDRVREDERVASVLRRELEWLKRGPKARSTKQKARIDRAEALKEHQWYEADAVVDISLATSRQGGKVIDCHKVDKAFPEATIMNGFSYRFAKGERIGIIGGNGAGKTTLLNLLSGRLSPDSGRVDIGETTRIGFFDQTSMHLRDDMRILEFIRESGESAVLDDGERVTASDMLGRFLFPSSMHYSRIAELSGGEKRRLYLLSVLMRTPNVLMFDEPTNDLDIKTLSILEDYLLTFKGTVFLVSHDRCFMDHVVNDLFILDGSGIVKRFTGSYTEYLVQKREQDALQEREGRDRSKRVKAPEKTPEAERKKLTWKETQRLKELEALVGLLENEKRGINDIFTAGTADPKTIAEYSARYKVIEKELNDLIPEWEALVALG